MTIELGVFDVTILMLSWITCGTLLALLGIFLYDKIVDRKLSRKRPLLNKDMTDSGMTRRELMEQNPLDGMIHCPTPEELKAEAKRISAVERIAKHLKELDKEDQLVMELGDDVLKGYTPGGQS